MAEKKEGRPVSTPTGAAPKVDVDVEVPSGGGVRYAALDAILADRFRWDEAADVLLQAKQKVEQLAIEPDQFSYFADKVEVDKAYSKIRNRFLAVLQDGNEKSENVSFQLEGVYRNIKQTREENLERIKRVRAEVDEEDR